MKNNYDTKKKLTIVALSAVALLLAGGLWISMRPSGNSDPTDVIAEEETQAEQNVDIQEVKSTADSKPQNTSTSATASTETTTNKNAGSDDQEAGGQAKTSDHKPKTPAEATPPETPATTTHDPADAADSKTPPKSTKTPAEPKTNTPASGEKNSKGQIYVPGFGWVDDSGEENSQGTAPNAGSGEDIGDM